MGLIHFLPNSYNTNTSIARLKFSNCKNTKHSHALRACQQKVVNKL